MRTILVIAWILFATILCAAMAIVLSFLDKTGNMSHRAARAWASSLLFVGGVRVRVRGARHLDPELPFIYMANHTSNSDIPVLLSCLPVQFRWLAKAELFRIPLFGLAMRRVGYISIDRSDRQSAIRSLKQAAAIIRGGTSVMIFPEGTRSPDGSIHPFKKGGFVLAVDAGVPVVPLVLTGTRAVLPKNSVQVQPGEVILQILPPIDTRAYSRRTKDLLMADVKEVMVREFTKGEAC